MAEVSKPTDPAVDPPLDLKDPAVAAILAWLIPGLGHWYQGRRAKSVLYFVAIMGLFGWGVYLGGSGRPLKDDGRNVTIGYGRAVYFSWWPEHRWPYFCQVFAGLPALPALYQAHRMDQGQRVLFGGFMAPPLPERVARANPNGPNADQPTSHELNKLLNRYFDLATFYTMVAGLLNVLAIYDAWGGPVVVQPSKKDKDPDEEQKKERA